MGSYIAVDSYEFVRVVISL